MKGFLLFLFSIISIISRSQTVGLISNTDGALDGYVLFAPPSDTTYLIDKCGKRIHTWHCGYSPGLSVYLLKDGSLLRCGNMNNLVFLGGGQGGMIQKLDWNSNVQWQYRVSDNFQCQHHDAIQLPNGNVLAIVWEYHSKADAQNNGRVSLGNQMWSDKLVEIRPVGNDSGVIVWQWRAWDHLVQDVDSTKINYGIVSDHPELINVNIGSLSESNSDWLHVNGLDYDSVTDQVLVSIHNLSEVFIIDHSTTMSQAASHYAGNSAHGGDVLYRWGNPQNYGRGTIDDQKLYQQHNPTWIPQGFPGAGKILVFNNGIGRPGNDYSTVETITPPPLSNYNYPIPQDSAFRPTSQDWVYTSNPPSAIYSFVEGGAQRLMNGNTLICAATSGKFIEIDSLGNTAWEYINPVSQSGLITQGNTPSQNVCFRATFIPSQYSGLTSQVLIPGGTLELNPLNYFCINYETGVAELKFDDGYLTAYPNPFQNTFALHVPVEVRNATLQVHDVMGKLLFQDENFSASPQSGALISIPEYKGVIIVSIMDKSGNHIWNATEIGM